VKKCNLCNVTIKDETDHCPLCGGVLDGDSPGHNTYPNVLKKERAINLIFRVMLFVAIVAVIISIYINLHTNVSFPWSLIVTFSFIYALIILYMFVKENAGYRVRLFGTCASGVVLVVLTDYILGFKRWSLNFVFPAVIIFVVLSLLVLMIINHRNWQSYIVLILAMVLISLIPIILSFLDVITIPFLANIAFGFSVFSALGVIILGGPRVKNELYRRFHVFGK